MATVRAITRSCAISPRPISRQRITAVDLAQIFSDLRRRRFDLFAVAISAPELTSIPALDANGMLHLAGFFSTYPLRIKFDLLFQNVSGQWKLFGISVVSGLDPALILTVDGPEGEGGQDNANGLSRQIRRDPRAQAYSRAMSSAPGLLAFSGSVFRCSLARRTADRSRESRLRRPNQPSPEIELECYPPGRKTGSAGAHELHRESRCTSHIDPYEASNATLRIFPDLSPHFRGYCSCLRRHRKNH
jgi:hypothetical protein